jgi:hypothetical protein
VGSSGRPANSSETGPHALMTREKRRTIQDGAWTHSLAVGERYRTSRHESSLCSTGILDPCTSRIAAEGHVLAGQDMKSAPSATRTRDLLLRRQKPLPGMLADQTPCRDGIATDRDARRQCA